jgi:hypothetical protein
VPLTKRVTLRLSPEGLRRLEAIAATRGVDPSRAIRHDDTVAALEAVITDREAADTLTELALASGSSGFVALDLKTEFFNPGRRLHAAAGGEALR